MTASIVQIVLLLTVVGLVAYLVANHRRTCAKAGVKLGFVTFVIACLWTIVHPDDLTVVASWIGVTRSTDLLLYVLVLAFMFTTVSSYIHFREQELRYARLVRAAALETAVRPEEETMISDSQSNSQKDGSMSVERNASSD